MLKLNIAQQRLHNQLITRQTFVKTEDVVSWLCAVQAQDYAAAKWALGLRMPNATGETIEQAFASGAILRTHVMRPTWHFVLPTDIRWMLALTAPRIKAANTYYVRTLGLDDTVFSQSNDVLAKALQGGKQLTRTELVSELKRAKIATDNVLRSTYIIMHAELDGIICSGARRGKQFTYALLDERVPQAKNLYRDEALAEIANRYFTSHGPATLQDFVWWSGLTVADARTGLEMVTSKLMCEVVEGQTYWFCSSKPPAEEPSQTISLLPNFDEYIVGYTDRSAIFDASHSQNLDSRGNVLFQHTIALDGRIVGTWKRTLTKGTVLLTPNLFISLTKAETHALTVSAERYSAFLNMPVHIN
ncbi:MAG TPA: winged helix DNA-binding domain-containing protein [Ktedonobacteraceae bacterium]|nr:winged helix DNA-binding domain-containing protein [Ktedonobacteraceae bacterium]